MIIDNSAANEFRLCPLLYFEKRIAKLEPKSQVNEVTSLGLGSRVHELLEEFYKELKGEQVAPHSPSPNEALELEAYMIISAYRQKYPVEDFEIVDVERTFKVALPDLCPQCYTQGIEDGVNKQYEERFKEPLGVRWFYCEKCHYSYPGDRHVYSGKIDLTFRKEIAGKGNVLNIMDHKTEKRRSRSNSPEKWAADDQATLYLWAASKIYKEEIGNFFVNVLTRPSDKMQEGPMFPDRQRLERSEEQIKIAIRDLVFTADEIERHEQLFKNTLWPAKRNACVQGWGKCEFYLPHTYGWSDDILKQKFQPQTPYLDLGDVPIIQ